MASIGDSYNPDAEPSSGYTPLPAGEYALEIVETDYVATSKGNGMVLKCKAQIVGGEYDCRPFYINYNLENDNEDAQNIGQRDFAGLRRATGMLNVEDSEELHRIPFRVLIGTRTNSAGEPVNRIVQYLFDDTMEVRPRQDGEATDWRRAA